MLTNSTKSKIFKTSTLQNFLSNRIKETQFAKKRTAYNYKISKTTHYETAPKIK